MESNNPETDAVNRDPPSVRCTYEDCPVIFRSEKAMKKHKLNDPAHDYCRKCDLDFTSYDEFAQHKAFRPETPHKECRICGDEFRTKSGLYRHIDLVSLDILANYQSITNSTSLLGSC